MTEFKETPSTFQVLSEIGQQITAMLSVETIIETVYEKVNHLMDASVFLIGIYEQENNRLAVPGSMEKGEKYPIFYYDLNDKNRPAVWCFKNQKEIIINDFQKEFNIYFPNSAVPKPVSGEQSESLVYIPLTIRDKKIGVLSVQSFKQKAYSEYHISILRNLGVYVSIALENARLYENREEEVRQRTRELEESYRNITLLSEIGQKITSTLHLDKILDTVYENVNQLMEATEFGIGVYLEEEQAIDMQLSFYESKKVVEKDNKVSIHDNNRLSVWCVKNKKEVFINDMDKEYSQYIQSLNSYNENKPGVFLLQSLICLPLVIEEKVCGLLYIQSKKKNAYTQLHLEMAKTLASYTAVALNNAEAYKKLNLALEEVEKLSVVVSKTDNAIIIANADGKIEWVNDAYTRITGYTLRSLIKEKGEDIFEISGNSEIKSIINDCIVNKKSVHYEAPNLTVDGRQLWIQTTLTPITDNDGVVVKFAAIESDITERKTAENQLKEKNKEITDSINYAQKIQRTIIPSEEQLKKLFPNSFVLFKPKDIVSGDFYWLDEKNGKVIIAVVDCTGHGVPGAFMSIIGNTLLNDIVNEKGIIKPSEILNELRKNIIHSLKQTGQAGEQQDGMDVAVCVFDFKSKKLEYAGAYNPLYILKNQELTELKPDRMPVGISESTNVQFTNNEYTFNAGEVFYIFSDGFKDQFGGPLKKKLTSIRFKKLLLSTYHEHMHMQKNALDSAFEAWKENVEQVDDICVCGIRV